MFEIGDKIVYGNMGVCSVTDILSGDTLGMDPAQKYYSLKPVNEECAVYVPTNTSIFMRPVISADDANRLIDSIPGMTAEVYESCSTQQLTEHYSSAINAHNCEDLIELIMSLYAKKQHVAKLKRKFGIIDERYMKQAQELLHTEFSIALGISKESVKDYISSRIGSDNTVSADE